MDGLTLLSRLSDLRRVLKAVIVSAYGDMPNIRIAMNRGAYDFLMKPIDFQDFELTVAKTRDALDEIRRGQQAREQLNAIQQELSVAARIQQSILPGLFPAFPGRTDFDIYAAMTPAKAVGGDLYDFFLLDEDHLGFVIGDVSGKGVPAAIFMAVSRTLLRATAVQGALPGDCLTYVNSVLARQSDSGMFVTLFYGTLNLKTGELVYASGGHNPPFLFSAGGEVRPLHCTGGLMVGLFDRGGYATDRIQLHPGDGIFLYTDGVTEAEDTAENQFSEERAMEVLASASTASMERMVQAVLAEVKAFSTGTPQLDDITAMAVRYAG